MSRKEINLSPARGTGSLSLAGGFTSTRRQELLGVTRRTLSYRISKYGLEIELAELLRLLRSKPRRVRPDTRASAVA